MMSVSAPQDWGLDSYNYEFPDHLIAQEPAQQRDQSRLLLVSRDTHEISHHHFFELPELLPENGGIHRAVLP